MQNADRERSSGGIAWLRPLEKEWALIEPICTGANCLVTGRHSPWILQCTGRQRWGVGGTTPEGETGARAEHHSEYNSNPSGLTHVAQISMHSVFTE